MICSRGCGEIYAKKDEAKHLGELCSKRTLPCEHCDKEITFKGVKFHLKVRLCLDRHDRALLTAISWSQTARFNVAPDRMS